MTTDRLFAVPDEAVELNAYLARIGYSGSREASLAMLHSLHRLHPQAIAFENLDPRLGRLPVRLDAASLMDKLVRGRRGGYCFEQNLLFGHMLSALGFRVSGLAARILWNQPEEAKTPRGHMLLRVHAGGEDCIADVGFGALTLTAPLRACSPILNKRHRMSASALSSKMACSAWTPGSAPTGDRFTASICRSRSRPITRSPTTIFRHIRTPISDIC